MSYLEKKTKSERFIEEIEKYDTIEEARTHYKEIAKKLECSPSLGYKVEDRIEKFLRAPETPTPEEPTVKIEEPEPIEIEEPEEPEPTEPLEEVEEPEEPEEEEEEGELVAEEVAPEERPPIEIPEGGFTVDKMQWTFEWGFNKIADITGYEGWRLAREESQQLADCWTPIFNTYMPQLIPHAPLIMAVITTAIIVVPRAFSYREHRAKISKEKPIEKAPEPTETPKPETPAIPALTPEEIKEKKTREGKQFVEKL